MAKCAECGKGFVPEERLLSICERCAIKYRKPTLQEIQDYIRWATHAGLEPL